MKEMYKYCYDIYVNDELPVQLCELLTSILILYKNFYILYFSCIYKVASASRLIREAHMRTTS